ncbi:MAG: monovalent cation/H+ antiporter complex subunit F [Casimicrobiaceae bacterium]
MLIIASYIAVAAIGIAMLLCMVRLVQGPDPADRIIAFDLLYIDTIALLLVMRILVPESNLFEAAVLIALSGFVGTAALARYVARREVIE